MKLIHGDCFEVMADMADGSVDHVITDPPYSERTHAGARTNRSPGGEALVSFDSFTKDNFLSFVCKCVNVSSRWVVMTCDFHHALNVEASDIPVVRFGAWVKTNPTPQISGDRPGMGWEPILILHAKGRKRWNGGGRSGVWTTKVIDRATIPTQKPLPLICKLIQDFTDPGETILDPCMGSGTVGVACKRLGRKFIGIEVLKDHYEIAKKRIEQEQMQGEMFT